MERSTSQEILDVAQDLCQRLGFNGFSYRDIAAKLGIKTASIHYHFATKGKLGEAILVRYRGAFAAQLSAASAEIKDPAKRVQRLAEVLGGTLKDGNKLCLCGMFAAELESIEPDMRNQVRGFFEDAEKWLAATLVEGKEVGVFEFDENPRTVARNYFASLQGLAIWARVFNEPARFDIGKAWLATGITV